MGSTQNQNVKRFTAIWGWFDRCCAWIVSMLASVRLSTQMTHLNVNDYFALPDRLTLSPIRKLAQTYSVCASCTSLCSSCIHFALWWPIRKQSSSLQTADNNLSVKIKVKSWEYIYTSTITLPLVKRKKGTSVIHLAIKTLKRLTGRQKYLISSGWAWLCSHGNNTKLSADIRGNSSCVSNLI